MKCICSICALFVVVLFQGACSMATVHVWERGDLARNEMAWEPDPMQRQLQDHIHTAKEGSAGGASTGGGGCGCY